MERGSFDAVNVWEFLTSLGIAIGVGMVRFLLLVRKQRGKFKWFDLVLEPLLAVLGGMVVWAVNEAMSTPDMLQASMVSVGAWAGPRILHFYEVKFFGGSRVSDERTRPAPLDEEER